jgi:hypothetical protein
VHQSELHPQERGQRCLESHRSGTKVSDLCFFAAKTLGCPPAAERLEDLRAADIRPLQQYSHTIQCNVKPLRCTPLLFFRLSLFFVFVNFVVLFSVLPFVFRFAILNLPLPAGMILATN